MKNITAFPLQWPDGWPRAKNRTSSKFGAHISFSRARDELLMELKRMGVTNNFVNTNVVLSTNVTLRQDGLPYAGQANPHDPGVAVYFIYRGKNMVFACDTYRNVIDNMWAIRKTIEALRGMERWGASDMMERAFTGFQALPPAQSKAWWDVLGVSRSASLEQVSKAWKDLAKKYHPDRGGSEQKMSEINRAWHEAERELA